MPADHNLAAIKEKPANELSENYKGFEVINSDCNQELTVVETDLTVVGYINQ